MAARFKQIRSYRNHPHGDQTYTSQNRGKQTHSSTRTKQHRHSPSPIFLRFVPVPAPTPPALTVPLPVPLAMIVVIIGIPVPVSTPAAAPRLGPAIVPVTLAPSGTAPRPLLRTSTPLPLAFPLAFPLPLAFPFAFPFPFPLPLPHPIATGPASSGPRHHKHQGRPRGTTRREALTIYQTDSKKAAAPVGFERT